MKPRLPSLRLLRLLRLDPLDLLVRETFGSGDAGACACACAWACECRLDREKEERPLSEAKGELRRRRRGDETSGLSGITTGFSLVPSPCVRLVGLPGVLVKQSRVSWKVVIISLEGDQVWLRATYALAESILRRQCGQVLCCMSHASIQLK